MPTITQILADAAAAAGVPSSLLLAQAQQESGLNPNAYNAKSGATGLLQLEPATAAQLGVANSLDPAQNAKGGASYLAQMYQKFGSWDLALAAYDWGPGNLARALSRYGSDWLAHAPSETQNYVSSILAQSGVGASSGNAQQLLDVTLAPAPPDGALPADSGPAANWALLAMAAVGAYLLADLLLG